MMDWRQLVPLQVLCVAVAIGLHMLIKTVLLDLLRERKIGLLTPYRRPDVNMASVWECSRNDAYEGVTVIVAASLSRLAVRRRLARPRDR